MNTRAQAARALLDRLDVKLPELPAGAPFLTSRTPIDGSELLRLPVSSAQEAGAALDAAAAAFLSWRSVPAPVRGEAVRRLGELVRRFKPELGELVSLEAGKIRSEGLGEVQEVIDICDFAVGLSRQLHGLTIASERPDHKLLETWHPLGVVGIISAFNFPAAVWAWNAALALVCGNTLAWKPSEKTPLTAHVFQALLRRALDGAGHPGAGISQLLQGGPEVGELLVRHPAVRLVSATGSTRMGREVGLACARLFKRSLLELGGNNAAIVCASADLELAVRSIVFSAAGTAGQRCTTLRRLFVCREHYAGLVARLAKAFGGLPVGDPLREGTLVGPLIDAGALERMEAALRAARALGATVHHGGLVAPAGLAGGTYVRPALVELPSQQGPMLEETFAPILYVVPFDTLEEAIALQNAVVHGLSSSIFTRDLREAELFLSARGSDCGIANVNLGTSGAEIGGAFGGEKETGGGRESGSDSWRGYMRRATSTINYGTALPLAQGVKFDL
jgi:aldehyde dehydrogenase (NAD+)